MIAIEGCHMLYTKIGGATPSRSGKLKKKFPKSRRLWE